MIISIIEFELDMRWFPLHQRSCKSCRAHIIRNDTPDVWNSWKLILAFQSHSYIHDHMRICAPDADIKGSDKLLHPTDPVGCNYLSLPVIPAQVII